MQDPPINLTDLDRRIQSAIDCFWETRDSQGQRQGSVTGRKDAGDRAKVTGGKHLDAFVDLIAALVRENCHGVRVFTQKHNLDPATVLPGYFRPTKYWDLVVLHGSQLVGGIELKSHVGPSFGNNYNNRSEEAIGNAVDINTAYREGAFEPSPKPWIGYMMLLEETAKSTNAVNVQEQHFQVFPEFKDASYAKRYEVGITRLVRDGLYSSACLMLSGHKNGEPTWREPSVELSFRRFAASLIGHALAVSTAA